MTLIPRITPTPVEIVKELDKHIIGQSDAKRAVAIALRNRWRRANVDAELRDEITPKNILMIGPTGVGKTEIARRLANLAHAPFIKVEATKFTEVGYVGKEVDSIIRDLAEVAVKNERTKAMEGVRESARLSAEERILDILLPRPSTSSSASWEEESQEQPTESTTRTKFRYKLRSGELNEKEIEIDVASPRLGVEIMAPPGMEEMTSQLQEMFSNMGNAPKKSRKLKISQAIKLLEDEEATKRINEEETRANAIELVEQHGIVFIDEIDKVCGRGDRQDSAGVSREGVQRDLLPLVEGSTVSTKYGMIKTDHILFIGSGAFHLSKPSDLIPELQGRLPIRVELRSLTVEDFSRILTEPDASLTEQYQALMQTEGVDLTFTDGGIKRIAEIAWSINERTENIGARRLHTVLERLLEGVSFDAPELDGKTITIGADFVNDNLVELAEDEDLSRYIL